MSSIEIRDLSYIYPGSAQPVLDGVEAEIKTGEFISIVGPNGSGKSTLARLICGLIAPSRGQILVNGLCTANAKDRIEIRRQVGLVLQNPDNQIVASRVEEDIAFGPENLNLSPDEVRSRVAFALKKVGLDHLKDRPPHLMSGGEKQRLAIAGILALRPAFLVLDEPTSMLDPSGRREVMQVLHDLSGQGTAIVIITHNMDEAAETDRVWVLGRGKIAADGIPGRIFNDPELVKTYGLDLPCSVRLAKSIAHNGIAVPDVTVNTDELVCFICHLFEQKN